MPKISVLMSAYRHEAYVAEAVESVLAQDYPDWELILRDDASPDATAKILNVYQDSRIRHLPGDQNLGESASLNQCLAAASGQYVAILNSDDVMVPDRLSRSLAALEQRPDLGAVFSVPELIDATGQPVEPGSHRYFQVFQQGDRSRQEWLRHFFYCGNVLCHPSVMMRREALDLIRGYEPLLMQLADFDLWLRLCGQYEIQLLPESVVRFRILPGEANASGDSPARRERLCYESSVVMGRFGKEPLLSQLHSILPEWIRPADDGGTRLRGLAFALLSVPSSGYHRLALELLTQSQTLCEKEGHERQLPRPSTGDLHAIMRTVRPCTMAVGDLPLYILQVGTGGQGHLATTVIRRPLSAGRTSLEVVPLPLDAREVRLEIGAGVSEAVSVCELSFHDGAGNLLWDLASEVSKGAALQLDRASLTFTGDGVLVSIRPFGSISLPRLAHSSASTMRIRLAVPGRDGAECQAEVLDLRERVRQLERERDKASKLASRLETAVSKERARADSAVRWTLRPWYRRLFSRWKGVTLNRDAP